MQTADNYPGLLDGIIPCRTFPDVAFATADAPAAAPPGIRLLRYARHRAPSPATHPYAQPMDRAALAAQAFARVALAARDAGLAPDAIVSHAGPGTGMFARELFPRARLVARFPPPDVRRARALALYRVSSEAQSSEDVPKR